MSAKYGNTAKNLLMAIKATLTSILKSATNTQNNSGNVLKKYVAEKKYQEAFNSLTMFCCAFEHAQALQYLMKCVTDTATNINEILNSPSCPQQHISNVAPICYAPKALSIEQLNAFNRNILAKVWSPTEVENLAHHNCIPDSLVHLRQRNSFTLEEMHTFVIQFESQLNIDCTWFFEHFPINSRAPPESKVQVKVFGKPITSGGGPAASLPSSRPEPSIAPGAPLPQLPPFKDDDFGRLTGFVMKAISNWNTWDI